MNKYIQPLRAFRRAGLMGCSAWVLGKSSGIWAVLSLPLNQLGPSAPLLSPLGSTLGSMGIELDRLGDHFGVLGGFERILSRAQGHRKCYSSESPLSASGAPWGGSWGGFGGLGCSLGQSWEVRMLLFQ